MTPVQPVRGTQSLLGEDADRLAAVVTAFDRVRRLYGFKRVEVPTIEQTAVFARTIGEKLETKATRTLVLPTEPLSGNRRPIVSRGDRGPRRA